MSQEKVDRYKHQKVNRKKIQRQERIKSLIRRTVLTLAAVALVGWIGFSAYDNFTANMEREVVAINYDAINAYMNGLSAN